MKKIGPSFVLIITVILFTVLLKSESLFAQTPKKPNQYSVGTLFSYHMLMSYEDYRPKLTKNGRIVSSPLFLRMQKTFDETEVYSFFAGNDSIGYPLLGVVREFTFLEDDRASSTGYLGFYFIYDRAWRKEVDHPPYYASLIKNYVAISMPLIGVRNSLVLLKEESYKVSLDLLISIGLINAGIFFNF